MSLVETYQKIRIDLYKPYLRAAMEKDMKEIADGQKRADLAKSGCIEEMIKIFRIAFNKKDHIKDIFG